MYQVLDSTNIVEIESLKLYQQVQSIYEYYGDIGEIVLFRYSSMTAIIDMSSSRKQRLETLFDFLTEGPYLPEQNIIEPTVSRLIPWSIAYWKRGLSGVPLHGSA